MKFTKFSPHFTSELPTKGTKLVQQNLLVGSLMANFQSTPASQLTQFQTSAFFKKSNKWTGNIFFKFSPNFSLRGWQRSETIMAEEYCWAITQESCAVMLLPIRFQCAGFWISTGLSFMYLCIYLAVCILGSESRNIRLAPDLAEGNYCTVRGVLVYTHFKSCV